MAKASFRMASASRESVFGAQTNTAQRIHRSDYTEGRLDPSVQVPHRTQATARKSIQEGLSSHLLYIMYIIGVI